MYEAPIYEIIIMIEKSWIMKEKRWENDCPLWAWKTCNSNEYNWYLMIIIICKWEVLKSLRWLGGNTNKHTNTNKRVDKGAGR